MSDREKDSIYPWELEVALSAMRHLIDGAAEVTHNDSYISRAEIEIQQDYNVIGTLWFDAEADSWRFHFRHGV